MRTLISNFRSFVGGSADSFVGAPRRVWMLRALFYCFLIVIIDRLIHFDTAPLLLSIAAVVGTWLGSRLAGSRLTALGFGMVTLLLYSFVWVALWGLGHIYSLPFPGSFGAFSLAEHGRLILLSFTVALISTWLFFRVKLTATIELAVLVLVLIQLLANHRDFRFDLPKVVNSLAWALSITPLTALVFFGALFSFGILGYLYVASLPTPMSESIDDKSIQESGGKKRWMGSSLALCALSAVILLVGSLVHRHYGQVSGSIMSNGVGDEGRQGMSPLGFHSALGGTNQPAAIIRLDSDYRANPFSPMLYLRESALSAFNGHEMVIAPSGMDRDIVTEKVGERFEADEIAGLEERQSVTQSVFLLADTKNVFGVDYPVSITPLKTPESKKFVGAYKVVSLAPKYSLAELNGVPLGDSNWSAEFRKHYLNAHSDPRYAELARKVTEGISDPVAKAFAVTRYLSKTSIYTLSPNHEVAANDDQTAPFLFGDHRGYCVHFAHATVYMFRSLGIPARIGTGYLTDLSQAKDGHALLRMSDRHAWAEVYLQGKGWIPFDTQPEQVESHAETEVDKKLLEDLMGMLGPNEEILPKTTPPIEPELPESGFSVSLPQASTILMLLASIILTFGLIKVWLRYGYVFGMNDQQRLALSYVAHAARLEDLGLSRDFGETRSDFARRLADQQISFSLTKPLLQKAYARPPSEKPSHSEKSGHDIAALRRTDLQSLKSLSVGRRIWGLINPSSVLNFLTRRGW